MRATHSTKRRSRMHSIPFDLTAEYLSSIWTARCPALGVDLVRGDRNNPHNASLDRIKPELGYTQGNVVWVSSLANRIKQEADSATIRKVADWLELAE